MKVLYVHSDKIMKNDMVWGIVEAGVEADIFDYPVKIDDIDPAELEVLSRKVRNYDIVLTQNFVPVVAEACHIADRPYASWIYDSPQYHLYRKEALYSTNFVFEFDKKQCERLKAVGLPNVFRLPLAGNVSRVATIEITSEEIEKYSSDVAFIGSLYNMSLYSRHMPFLSESGKEDIDKLFNTLFCKWGNSTVYNRLKSETVSEIIGMIPKEDFSVYNIDSSYAAETLMLCYELTNRERIAVLSEASKYCKTVLYTKELPENINIPGCIIRPPVYEDELYKTYYSSKINLNITMRSIESGIPQRVFDIMAVGGFVLSDRQEEIGELFDIGKDIEVYSSVDEMNDKIKYYLSHDDERIKIGLGGYYRVKEEYNYKKGIERILKTVFSG